MSPFEIVDSSPEAKAIVEVKETKPRVEYPFDKLLTGKSFAVPFAEDLSESALRMAASRAGKKIGCKFRVLKHDKLSCYEVARIG